MDRDAETKAGVTRKFLRVTDFDRLQYHKRPKRPTWVKSYTRDLDLAIYLGLSIANRGFLCDFIKLAASMSNRVPNDARMIAHRLNIRPQVAGKALRTLISRGFVSEFVEDLETCKIKDLEHVSEAGGSPNKTVSISKSNSYSKSPNTDINSEDEPFLSSLNSDVCVQCDGEGCAWCRQTAQTV